MSLRTPYFFIKETEQGKRVCHNCDGGVAFMATEDINSDVAYLITLAIEHGKREKAEEIKKALGVK